MKKSSKTLVILTPGFPANEADTTCLPPQQVFVRALKRSFPEINVIVLSFHYPYLISYYKWHNVTVYSFNGRNRGKIKRVLLWMRVWKVLKQIRKENQLLGILSFWCTECAWVGKRFARKFFVQHYCWILGQDAKKENRYVKFIRPVADELVALSDFLQKEFYINHFINPKHVIPVGIDSSLFGNPSVEKNIDLLGAGSLIPLKRYEVFIEIVKELTSSYPELKTIICGKGPEVHYLKYLIEKQQLEKNLLLADEKSHPETLQLMQRSKIFLHTSEYEGFGVVCLEALYAGAHVVSFCKPMIQEIEHWHIVQSKKQMVQKMLELLKSYPIDHTPVLPYSIDYTATAIMKLFGYNK